jgi:hypothetical protein
MANCSEPKAANVIRIECRLPDKRKYRGFCGKELQPAETGVGQIAPGKASLSVAQGLNLILFETFKILLGCLPSPLLYELDRWYTVVQGHGIQLMAKLFLLITGCKNTLQIIYRLK